MNLTKKNENRETGEGVISWKAPSNLAIIKYWGKHGRQLPANPSISLTLSEAFTRTTLRFSVKVNDSSQQPEIHFRFEGQPKPAFEDKIRKFINGIYPEFFPFLNRYKLDIESENSFPHSSGIASSASSMAALALCLTDMEYSLQGNEHDAGFYSKASEVARLGSGSAARSLYPYMAQWGAHKDIKDASDLYAVDFSDRIHEVFKNYHDDILIISGREKSVSSTAGHALMNNNVYAEARYRQANDRLSELLPVLKTGDIEAFQKIAEDEALTLHALMMCSEPSYILMEPSTLEAIQKIRQFRYETDTKVCFSLDAGPNIHLLYPDFEKEKVSKFVHDELRQLCVDDKIIRDMAGKGPEKLV